MVLKGHQFWCPFFLFKIFLVNPKYLALFGMPRLVAAFQIRTIHLSQNIQQRLSSFLQQVSGSINGTLLRPSIILGTAAFRVFPR